MDNRYMPDWHNYSFVPALATPSQREGRATVRLLHPRYIWRRLRRLNGSADREYCRIYEALSYVLGGLCWLLFRYVWDTIVQIFGAN
jgi:hypothetical protein